MGEPTRFRTWHAAAFLAAVSTVSAVSALRGAKARRRGPERVTKAPPRWVFGAVWSGLNVLQLWADLRILNDRSAPDRNVLLGLRAVNWTLYVLFTPSFFRAKSPAGGEAISLAEGVTAGATMALLARSDPLAAAALAPLTLWTAYAGLLGTNRLSANPDRLVDQLRWEGAF